VVACHQSQCCQNFNAPLVNTAMALQCLPEVQQHLASPFPVWKHMRRNPFRKKRRQKKSIFFYGTTFKKNESGRDFQRVQIWYDRAQKKKKNYGSHPLLFPLSSSVIQSAIPHATFPANHQPQRISKLIFLPSPQQQQEQQIRATTETFLLTTRTKVHTPHGNHKIRLAICNRIIFYLMNKQVCSTRLNRFASQPSDKSIIKRWMCVA
jgi:hypothetical protein